MSPRRGLQSLVAGIQSPGVPPEVCLAETVGGGKRGVEALPAFRGSVVYVVRRRWLGKFFVEYPASSTGPEPRSQSSLSLWFSFTGLRLTPPASSLADRVRSQKRNQARKLLADSVSTAVEPETLVLEAAGKDCRPPPFRRASRTSVPGCLILPAQCCSYFR